VIPVYGFLQGDTIGLLVLAYPEDTMRTVCEKLKSAASVRVAPRPGGRVVFRDRVLDPELRVDQAGLAPLDRIDVRFDQEGSL
jgi:hypothetical protein